MGRKKAAVEARVLKAAKLCIECPKLTVPKAMLAEGFSKQESQNKSEQMKVRRCIKDLGGLVEEVEVPGVVVAVRNDLASPLTNSSTANSTTTDDDASKKSKGSSKSKSSSSSKLAKAAGVKSIRMTSSQAQQDRVNKKKIRELQSKSLKEATRLYASEKAKKGKGMSATAVCDIINNRNSTNIQPRQVQRYVKNGMIGESPVRRGQDGRIPKDAFRLLVGAFVSFVRINQANADDATVNTRKNLQKLVNGVVNSVEEEERTTDKLLLRLLAESGIDINASVDVLVEERRIRWTTYENLRLWFETWKRELEELGFGCRDDDNKFFIPQTQLERILNLDESCLSLDGSNGKRGGRPVATFYDPSLPRSGKAAIKSSITTTFIAGSTAAGEALPPHFQFSTKATAVERERIRRDVFLHLHRVRGKFGAPTVKSWPSTVGLNAKGGMDDDEFEKYLMNSIVPLYPDAADITGKRVLIKIDSGPGRLQIDMLARLRNLGFILYPGVPNTTSVSQETDQSYGLFKHHFRKNLEKLTSDRIEKKATVSVSPALVGMLVFGGIDPVTNRGGYTNAFAISFTKDKCKEAWEKVGAAPLTMECLKSHKVRHEGGVKGDPLQEAFKNMDRQNEHCCILLQNKGYKADLLRAKIKPRIQKAGHQVTEPYTQERVEALAKAITHGDKFHVTGGTHLTHDDILKASEIEQRESAVKAREAERKLRFDMETWETEALQIVEKEIAIDKLNTTQLSKLLLWKGVKKKEMGKL